MKLERLLVALALGLTLTLATLGMLATPIVLADGFTVTKTQDSADGVCGADCSLREAISAANANAQDDTITLLAGTYVLTITGTGEDSNATGDLDITSSDALTITGAGAGQTIINANGIDRVLHIHTGTVVISGVTIYNGRFDGSGNYGGGINNDDADLTLINTRVYSNSAFAGGGVYVWNGSATLNETQVLSNSADSGGGVYVQQGSATLSGTRVVSNSAVSGGGVIIIYGSMTMTGTQVLSNSAQYGCGGVCVGAGSSKPVTLNVSGGMIAGNSAGNSTFNGEGGGVYVVYGSATLSGTQVVDNSASSDGGGVYVNWHGSVTLIGVQVTGNSTAYRGGGVCVIGNSTLNMSGGVITDNVASNRGGGVFVSGSATLTETQVVSNSASDGGGVFVNSGSVILTGTWVLGNSANNSGGMQSTFGGTLLATNGCIVYNSDTALRGNQDDLDASDNWWGAANGPGGEGPGDGDSVNGWVIYDNFKTSPPDGCPSLPLVDLRMSKSVTPTLAIPGQTITYTLAFSNVDAITATNVVIADSIPVSVTVTDVISTGVAITDTGAVPAYVWQVANLAQNEGGVITITGVLSDVLPAGAFSNTATITATADNDSDVAVVTVVNPVPSGALILTKTARDVNGGGLYVGDVIEYRVMVRNITATQQTNVVITDAIPANTTYVLGSASVTRGSVSGPDPLVADVGTLATGEYAILTFRVTVDAEAVGSTVGNSASADSDQSQPPINVGPILPQPDPGPVNPGAQLLEIRKTAEDLNGSPLYVGDVIEYQVMVRNITDTAQTNVVITDAIPANTIYVPGSAVVTQGSVSDSNPLLADIGSLAADGYAILTFRVTVDAGAVGLPVTNQASATSDEQPSPVTTDPTPPYPGPYDLPDPGPNPVEPGAQLLEIRKTAEDLNGSPLYVGDVIEYQVMVRNITDTAQNSVVITDAIPANTTYAPGSASVTLGNVSGPDPLVVEVSSLAGGEIVTLTFRVTVTADAVGLPVTNQASTTSDKQVDPVITYPTPPYPGPYDFPDPGPDPVKSEGVTPPTVTSPVSGTLINDATPTFTGTADAGATVTVTTHPTGTVLCVAIADAGGNWTCTPTTGLSEGENTVTVIAGDGTGNESDPTFVDITVDTIPPDPPIVTAPISGTVIGDTPTFRGTGEPDGQITVYDDEDNVICTTTINPDETWTCVPDNPLDEGEQSCQITVTDEAGNESDSTPVSIIVSGSNIPPVADAGGDQSVNTGEIVTLDGSGSYDSNGDDLVYSWAQEGGPAVTFTPNLSITTFTAPPSATVLTFTLVVTDTLAGTAGTLGLPSVPDTVVVTVSEGNFYIYLPLVLKSD
ncbi:MAG: DUF11 domain-containing protein [Chloroflexi bacterium]|nr:DUF11 domain-containing protein [Chloroflexota bacterium]